MLDRSRPYAQVYGLDGVYWHQDGRNFNFKGDPLDEHGRVVRDPEPVSQGDGMEAVHWRHLKAMVEQYGGEWTTKEAALSFLRGRPEPVSEMAE